LIRGSPSVKVATVPEKGTPPSTAKFLVASVIDVPGQAAQRRVDY
jgi:hypothetical protein